MRCLLILFGLLITGEMLIADTSSSSRIAAVVNKSIITQTDLMNRLRLAAISSGLEPTPSNLDKIKPQMVRVMIDEKLQLQAGEEGKIKVSEDQVKEAVQHLEEANGMPKGTVAHMLEENHIPFKTLENQIRASLIWAEVIREKYASALQISEGEIAQELKLQKEKETKTQYHLAEIVLPFDGPEQEEHVKADLNRLIEALQKGAHFSALAQQFSQAATAAQGGDMGWLTEDQLAPEIKEFISHMEPGQLSQPIRTSKEYIIIGYIENKSPGAKEKTELSEKKAREIIAERKLSLLASRELRDLRRHAFIEVRM